MQGWLPIEFLVGALLATTFVCVGLLALWAAGDHRHWFVRTAAVFVALSTLVAIPALEPFAILGLQSLLIACGVMIYRRRTATRSSKPDNKTAKSEGQERRLNFSLTTLLLMMVMVAVGIAIAVRFPRLNFPGWVSVLLSGAAGGIATLAGAWMYFSLRKKLVWPLALVLCSAVGFGLSAVDWLVPAIVSGFDWPPDTNNPGVGFGTTSHTIAIWPFVLPLVALLIVLLVSRWCACLAPVEINLTGNNKAMQGPLGRPLARCTFLLLAVLVAAFPLYVLGKLLTPDPIPRAPLPSPNAYDDFIAAGKIASATKLDGTLDIELASAAQLQTEVKKCEKTYSLVAGALSRPCRVPVEYSYSAGFLPMEHLISMRAVGRALWAKARLEELDGRYAEAAEIDIDAIEFGNAIKRGGLLIDGLVGIGCSGYGIEPLYKIRGKLSSDELDRCIELLVRADASDEPFDDIWYRDRVWSQRAYGWLGHLNQVMSDLSNYDPAFMFIEAESYPFAFRRYQATIRLLIVELALARFHQANNRWPAGLHELDHNYLAAIPPDPLDPQRGPLMYRRTSIGYSLYSFGVDGDDDGGRVPAKDEFGYFDWQSDGDLQLDAYFAHENGDTADTSQADGNEFEGLRPDQTIE